MKTEKCQKIKPQISKHKPKKKLDPMVRDFIIFTISSATVGTIMLK
jgi:hypothetical protein